MCIELYTFYFLSSLWRVAYIFSHVSDDNWPIHRFAQNTCISVFPTLFQNYVIPFPWMLCLVSSHLYRSPVQPISHGPRWAYVFKRAQPIGALFYNIQVFVRTGWNRDEIWLRSDTMPNNSDVIQNQVGEQFLPKIVHHSPFTIINLVPSSPQNYLGVI